MFSKRQWDDLLYDLGLFGQEWLYVNRVREAYISWVTMGEREISEGWGEISEDKLQELLSDPRANLPEVHRRLIVDVLHHVLSSERFPLPPLPKIT